MSDTAPTIPPIQAPQPIRVYPRVLAIAITADVIIASHDIDHDVHDNECCGCLILRGSDIICNECGFVFGQA